MDDRLINEKYGCCQGHGTKAEDFMISCRSPPPGGNQDGFASTWKLQSWYDKQ